MIEDPENWRTRGKCVRGTSQIVYGVDVIYA